MCIRVGMFVRTIVKSILSNEERFNVVYGGRYCGFLHDWVEAYDYNHNVYFNEHNTMYTINVVYTRNY